MDYRLAEPADDYTYHGNTPYSKEDMKKRNVPCIIVIPDNDSWDGKDFYRHVGSDNIDKFFFGDDIKKLEKYHIIKRA